MARLGVNIDHVATLRQARGGREPDPVFAAQLAELGGADGITIHLREDRRHIQERDLLLLKETVAVRLNLEISIDAEVVGIALKARPTQVTLVPERREELTTEGGLDLIAQRGRVAAAIERFREAGIPVSLFIDPDPRQVAAAVDLRVFAVELHTGRYAEADDDAVVRELGQLRDAGRQVLDSGLTLHAGHGLNYRNTPAVADIEGMAELNIGHSIISRSVFVGLDRAVREMKELIRSAHRNRTI